MSAQSPGTPRPSYVPTHPTPSVGTDTLSDDTRRTTTERDTTGKHTGIPGHKQKETRHSEKNNQRKNKRRPGMSPVEDFNTNRRRPCSRIVLLLGGGLYHAARTPNPRQFSSNRPPRHLLTYIAQRRSGHEVNCWQCCHDHGGDIEGNATHPRKQGHEKAAEVGTSFSPPRRRWFI